ncbi:hypothetical protein QBA75_40060 [Streptomyces stelliscabiei]
MGEQGGLDLAEFDAVAAHLDLVVEPAQELQHPSAPRRTRSPLRYQRRPSRSVKAAAVSPGSPR